MRQPPVGNSVYDNEYYSGTQAGLYIGDVFIDEVVGFSYHVQQVKTPIYGYASQLFNAVAPGPVVINGGFSINYKEANYLYIVLMRYHMFNKQVRDILKKTGVKDNDIKSFKDATFNGVPHAFSGIDPRTRVTRQGIEGFLKGTASEAERYKFYQSLSGYASVNKMDLEFEHLAEVLEDSVWGKGPKEFDNTVRRTDDNFFDSFDIYLTFGDYNNALTNHTVERITDVHLTGRGKEVRLSGEPILEEYQFIARNNF